MQNHLHEAGSPGLSIMSDDHERVIDKSLLTAIQEEISQSFDTLSKSSCDVSLLAKRNARRQSAFGKPQRLASGMSQAKSTSLFT